MERYREIEKSIIKTYRRDIWSKFIKAIKDYDLIKENDHIAVCISGGKDSFLLAKCFDELKRHNQYKFEVSYILMNPGYSEYGINKIKENASILNIDLNIFKSPIFDIVNKVDGNPCYLCARMRRGYLYDYAKSLGANKIALAHHFDDVIETNLLNLLYAGRLDTMEAILDSKNFECMQLIRPFYYVREQSILNFTKYNNLEFINCDCPLNSCKGPSKRKEIKDLIKQLENTYKDIPKNIFTAFKDK
jgi:tRNA(Ile)-lysidine synthase TilS/MesJ